MRAFYTFLLLLGITSVPLNLLGQRYMVHFSDKANSNYSIDRPEEFLSSRSIERRQKQGISIVEEDLPVNGEYILAVDDIDGVATFFTTKWLNAVLIETSSDLISEIEALPFVEQVEFVAPLRPTFSSEISDGTKMARINKSKEESQAYGEEEKLEEEEEQTAPQNSILGIDQLHADGFRGEDMMIAVTDGGFFGVDDVSAFENLLQNDHLKYSYDYVGFSEDVYQYSTHGTKVLSVMAGFIEDEFVGSAYNADYLLFITEDDCPLCEHRIEEYNWLFAAEAADSIGADVINVSLGYNLFEDPEMDYTQSDMDGRTAVISVGADKAFEKGILVVASAGNEGSNSWGIITAPADGLNTLAIGNARTSGARAGSSSLGPSADSRIKPDLMALGSSVKVVSSSGAIVTGSGTSFSSPQVAALAALIWQAYPELTVSELRFLMLTTANNATTPDNEIGYGTPSYIALRNFFDFADSEQSVVVYPNPVENDLITVRVSNPAENAEIRVRILSTKGEEMFVNDIGFSWSQNDRTIDISNLSQGLYIMEMTTPTGQEQIRFVKI